MIDRRQFLLASGSCAAQVALLSMAPPLLRSALRQRSIDSVLMEPWARIERLGESVWACISTPLSSDPEARRTFSNGGIVAGRSGVVVIEGFASDAGAQWIAEQARGLTGRAPTHVVLTHYHGDHSSGLGGYGARGSGPIFVTTEATRQRLGTVRPAIAELLAGAEQVGTDKPRVIDLGGRTVTITPRSGHTTSDLSVAVDDSAVVFGGDLVWNGMFPNYVDAIPTLLTPEVRALSANNKAVIVPGHGAIPSREEFGRYLALLDFMEDSARRAHAAGRPPAEAAAGLALPAALGEWTMFSPKYFQVALEAWERVLTP
jgi:glyoxylase-like metal-dependent hydrolase (beta-lactamase superfamily II)